MTLQLRVPAVADSPDDAVETRGVYVEEWVEALPFANPEAATRQLLDAVTALNRHPLAHKNRLTLLEIYLPAYLHLAGHSRSAPAAATVAAVEKRRAVSALDRALATALAYGYKLALADALKLRGLGKRELATALQRAMACLCRIMLHCYHDYIPAPTHIWRELAELYRFAAERNLAAVPNATFPVSTSPASTLDAHYKTLLVTSLTDPYHLVHGDVWKAHQFIAERVDGVTLEPMHTVDKAAGIFYVSATLDKPPVPYRNLSCIPAGGILLNTRPFLTQMQRRLAQLEPRRDELVYGEPLERETRFTRRILNTLGRPPSRQMAREPTDGDVTLTTGLATAHYFIRTGNQPSDVQTDREDVIELGDVLPGEQTDFSRHTYASGQWSQVNRSGGGIGIVRPVRPNHTIGVGDLIGILTGERNGAQQWRIGALRWLNIAGDGEYNAGVEFLSERPRPIALRPEDDDGRSIIGLELTDLDTIVLAVPIGTYKEGRKFITHAGKQVRRLRGTRVRESLLGCDLIECTADIDPDSATARSDLLTNEPQTS